MNKGNPSKRHHPRPSQKHTYNLSKGTSLVVQWLGLYPSIAGVTGSIPDRGTKILHATVRLKKKKVHLYKICLQWKRPWFNSWVRKIP